MQVTEYVAGACYDPLRQGFPLGPPARAGHVNSEIDEGELVVRFDGQKRSVHRLDSGGVVLDGAVEHSGHDLRFDLRQSAAQRKGLAQCCMAVVPAAGLPEERAEPAVCHGEGRVDGHRFLEPLDSHEPAHRGIGWAHGQGVFVQRGERRRRDTFQRGTGPDPPE